MRRDVGAFAINSVEGLACAQNPAARALAPQDGDSVAYSVFVRPSGTAKARRGECNAAEANGDGQEESPPSSMPSRGTSPSRSRCARPRMVRQEDPTADPTAEKDLFGTLPEASKRVRPRAPRMAMRTLRAPYLCASSSSSNAAASALARSDLASQQAEASSMASATGVIAAATKSWTPMGSTTHSNASCGAAKSDHKAYAWPTKGAPACVTAAAILEMRGGPPRTSASSHAPATWPSKSAEAPPTLRSSITEMTASPTTTGLWPSGCALSFIVSVSRPVASSATVKSAPRSGGASSAASGPLQRRSSGLVSDL
mmetsp:Transcript_16866/g.57026  ORF Transcript_16866/g.57026 Transcript_16866/m.57026 type:complete len:314 (-) Transcript_16866:302-1243(-)